SSTTAFAIDAVDNTSSTIVSGIARINAFKDGHEAGFRGDHLLIPPFGFFEGPHGISYAAQDNGGNLEAPHSVALFVDITVPVSTLTVSPSAFFNGTSYYVSSGTAFAFDSVDPSSAGAASGVAAVEYSLDGSSFTAYLSSFSVTADGAHRLVYFARD